jgi:hypothetical protein
MKRGSVKIFLIIIFFIRSKKNLFTFKNDDSKQIKKFEIHQRNLKKH